MDEYAGRVLAERYRLPMPPSHEYELVETRAFDTYSGQEVLVRQVPLPEVVDAEVVGAESAGGPYPAGGARGPVGRTGALRHAEADRAPADPAVRRALEAATAAARIPDHPQLDQVFDVFAQDGSLWIVSELVRARPLAALLAERTLSPHRAAEVAADILTALRALHAHGWTHRNITVRTVLVCDDGRAILTGLAAGAAEEALCGYEPVPGEGAGAGGAEAARSGGTAEAARSGEAVGSVGPAESPASARPAESLGSGGAAGAGAADARKARAGAIAAYQAGARAAAARGAVDGGGGAPSGPGAGSKPGAGQGAGPHGAGPHGAGPHGAGPHGAGSQGVGPQFSPYSDHIDTGSGGPGSAAYGGSLPGAAPRTGGGRIAGAGVPGGVPETAAAGGTAEGGAAAAAAEPVAGPVVEPRPAYGRPSAALAAERARQARINVVGAVTERWAPEQAGPVHENWQLAPPVGPATDLWAIGALLFRSVQGHAPFPEDSAAELVQLVCSEPPSYAEECGALRPVVESLMRQDPTERPDFEELRGWLRSLIRTAPEPDLGSRVVTVPALEGPADPRRLPIVRRRGELVRKGRHKKGRPHRERPRKQPRVPKARRHERPQPQQQMLHQEGLRDPGARLPRGFLPDEGAPPQGRPTGSPRPPEQPKRSAEQPKQPPGQPKPPKAARPSKPAGPPRRVRGARRSTARGMAAPDELSVSSKEYGSAARAGTRGPRHLGRLLVGLVLALLVGAVLYAMLFMPKAGSRSEGASGTAGAVSQAPNRVSAGGTSGQEQGEGQGQGQGQEKKQGGERDKGKDTGTRQPQTTEPGDLAKGFAVRKDPEGFQVAVRDGWERRGANDRGQVRYTGGGFELVIVPGRDTTAEFGSDPMAYQQDKERELAPYRDSSWSASSGLRRIDVGKTAMAEGTFNWQDSSGRQVYVRNLAMIHGGRYHLVLVIGPDDSRRETDRIYEQATGSYRPG